jgi:MOSC domain-containing protein YiiM
MRSAPISVGPNGLEGDAPADTKNHGGPDRAICVYPSANLKCWAALFDRNDIGRGAFGENLTVDGIDEDQAAIGDIWIIGKARLQVSQPRSPCWKLARHVGIADFAAAVRDSGRTGWYMRVLECGEIEPGQPVVVVERLFPHLTVSAVNKARWSGANVKDITELASNPALSSGWRLFLGRLENSASEL